MDHLPQLHQLFPKATNIELKYFGEFENESYLSTFEELEELSFSSNYFMNNFPLEPFTEFLNNFNNKKKLKKITLPTFQINDEKDVLEFYKILFEKTNLEEFKRINSHSTLQESKMISSWIQNNSTLQTISLDRKLI
jgi:hypothetical protein